MGKNRDFDTLKNRNYSARISDTELSDLNITT